MLSDRGMAFYGIAFKSLIRCLLLWRCIALVMVDGLTVEN